MAMLKSVERVMAAWVQADSLTIGRLQSDGHNIFYHDTCLLAWTSEKAVLNRTHYSASTTRVQKDIEEWLRDPKKWRADFDRSVVEAVGTFPLGVQPKELLEGSHVLVGKALYKPPWPPAPLPEPEPLPVSRAPSIYQYNPEVGF